MSNLYQRLCQTGELVSTSPARLTARVDHTTSLRLPCVDVAVNSHSAREILSESFTSQTLHTTISGEIVYSSVVLTDENDSFVGSDSEAGDFNTGAQPSTADDDSLLSYSAARETGDYDSARNDNGSSSDKSSELSSFFDCISDRGANLTTFLVGERELSMVSIDEDLTVYSEDTSEFDACIPTNLNLLDSISSDVASHVTFDEETSLDDNPPIEDEAFQGELWLAVDAKGRGSRSPSSSIGNKYSKYRGMQSRTVTNSSPEQPRIRAWHIAIESDFLFPSNATQSPRVGKNNAEFSYLELTKKVDARIQAILSGDRNAMNVLHQQLDQLKASTKSSGAPSECSAMNA